MGCVCLPACLPACRLRPRSNRPSKQCPRKTGMFTPSPSPSLSLSRTPRAAKNLSVCLFVWLVLPANRDANTVAERRSLELPAQIQFDESLTHQFGALGRVPRTKGGKQHGALFCSSFDAHCLPFFRSTRKYRRKRRKNNGAR